MDRFYVLFNSMSVISGRLADYNEMLCAMEPPFTVGKISLRAGVETRTARSVGQRLIGAPKMRVGVLILSCIVSNKFW